MVWRSAIGRKWERWSDAVKRELLREPDRVLIDCGPEAFPPRMEKPAQPEMSLEQQ